MLAPKKIKHRKQQKGRLRGTAYRGSTLAFGDFGLQAVERGWLAGRPSDTGARGGAAARAGLASARGPAAPAPPPAPAGGGGVGGGGGGGRAPRFDLACR